jgi:hypothetical protein
MITRTVITPGSASEANAMRFESVYAGRGRNELERGSSLVEVLAASVILGSLVIAVLVALAAVASSSSIHRSAATTDTVTRDYAESLKVAVTQAGAWCRATPYSVTYVPPPGFTVVQSPGTCPTNNATTPQFQVVTLTAQAPNNSYTDVMRVVLRKP